MLTAVPPASRTICLLLLLSIVSRVRSQTVLADENMALACGSNNTASNSYISNLSLLYNKTLYNEAGKSLYYNATEGGFPDTVYGLYLCKFNISFKSCQKCIVSAVNTVMQKCAGTKEALIWYQECLVRFSDNSLAIMDTSAYLCMRIAWRLVRDNVTKILAQSFNDISAMQNLGSRNYATKDTNISGLNTLNSYVQCIPVLSKEDCRDCLNKAIDKVSECFDLQGLGYGRIIFPSCYIGYELYPISSGNKTGSIEFKYLSLFLMNLEQQR